jgi:putative transposase
LRTSTDVLRGLIELGHPELSVRRQCALLGLPRSTLYWPVGKETEENLGWMRLIDELYLSMPFYGSRKIAEELKRQGHAVNRKRVQRLMRLMGLQAIYPRKKTTIPGAGHKIYPYLLRGVKIDRMNQVWSTDITYVPMRQGFMYLVAVMDWCSRYVLSWRLSNSLDGDFCLEALDEALNLGRPEVFNTDQGSQFTSTAFTGRLASTGVAISMDGRGRALDNVFIERLWRTMKYENIYLKEYATVDELIKGLTWYINFYNRRRLHQSLDYKTPWEVYQSGAAA